MRAWRASPRRIVRIDRAHRRFFSCSHDHQEPVNVARLLQTEASADGEVTVHGWIRSVRKQKRVAFAVLGDGSTVEPLQAVFSKPELAAELSYGTAVKLSGSWVASIGGGQRHELQVSGVQVLGQNDPESNPLQPKYQTAEYLRTIPHLRPRIPANALLLRLRSEVIAILTRFFNDEGFVQAHLPIITSSDCEGAGEVFTVATNGAKQHIKARKSDTDPPTEQFFRKEKYLTVSNQLHLEALSMAVNKVWTLSPTFRAEQSDTSRHLAEFYMLEAELSFVDDLTEVMDLVEDMLRAVATNLQVTKVGQELLQLRRSSSSTESDESDGAIDADRLQQRWNGMAMRGWPRITYADAIQTLQEAFSEGRKRFEFPPTYDDGLHAEHERFIAETVGQGKPVFVTDYPAAQKPFYMPQSASTVKTNDPRDTAACFDLLVPDLCELVGGSLREHRLEELRRVMREKAMGEEKLHWYLDLRKYGSVPHGGFGLGFDRLLCYLTGIGNIRDVVTFPRWYGRCDC